jgi:hypothetical protein
LELGAKNKSRGNQTPENLPAIGHIRGLPAQTCIPGCGSLTVFSKKMPPSGV